MEDLTDLYQEIILNHNKRPRNEGEIDPCPCQAEGYNPLCGDRLTVYVREDDGKIGEIKFVAEGCAISKASASIMTTKVGGLTREEVHQKVREVIELLTAEEEPAIDPLALGEIAALIGVRRFPARIKCATLAWHALEDALRRCE